MKKLFILLSIILVAFIIDTQAQERNVPIATDTVQGAETVYFAPTYTYTFTGSTNSTDYVSFYYTTVDVADSLASLYLQGSADGVNYVNITNQATTTTDGHYRLYEANAIAVKYRLAATCIAGDTVILKNIYYLQKGE